MDEVSSTVEYAPQALCGSVELRRTATMASVTIRPTSSRILPGLISPLVLTAFGGGLYWLIYTLAGTSGPRGWGILTFPLIFAGIGAVQAVFTLWRVIHPILFEVTGESLTYRWRTLTEAKSLAWPRPHIKNVRVERIRIQNEVLKRWSLVLHLLSGGKIVIFLARREELEVIAKALNEALGVSTADHPAMAIPKPAGCRYTHFMWADGVAVEIPPRSERLILAVLTIGCTAIAVCTYLFIRWLTADELLWNNTWSRWGSAVSLSLIGAAILWAVVYQAMKKGRRRIVILATPTVISATETGFLHPLNAQWKSAEIREITAVLGESGRGGLHIRPHEGTELVIAEREPLAHLEWVAAVLSKSRETLNAAASSAS